MSESRSEKKQDVGINCDDPYDNENDCVKCRDPPPGSSRPRCESECRTGQQCRRYPMDGLPVCWQHFEVYISGLNQPDVRDSLEDKIKLELVKRAGRFPKEIADLVVAYGEWTTWKTSDPKPKDWKNITRLEIDSETWPKEFPPKLKELKIRITQRVDADVEIPDVTHLHILSTRYGLKFRPPSNIESLTVEKYAELESLNLRDYEKLVTLNLHGEWHTMAPGTLKLGSQLEHVSMVSYRHTKEPKDMFPNGKADELVTLEFGSISSEVESLTTDAYSDLLQKMYTLSEENFPKLKNLVLYNRTIIDDNIRLNIPKSVTRLTIPGSKIRKPFFQDVYTQNTLKELVVTFSPSSWFDTDSWKSLPPKLESLVVKNVSTKHKIDLTNLPKLVSFDIKSAVGGNRPEIVLSPNLKDLRVCGHRIRLTD